MEKEEPMPDSDPFIPETSSQDPLRETYSLLLVDDEKDLLTLGKIFLERTGNYRVDTRISAKEALASLQTVSYDAIISDYQMTGMSGIEFLKNVRNQAGDIPFILFTGRGREEVVIEAIENGVDFYVQKGGDPGAQFIELSYKIQKAIAIRRDRQELVKSEQRFKSLIQNSSDIIRILNPQGTIIFSSPSTRHILGFEPEFFIGKNAFDFVHPDDRERVRSDFSEVIKCINPGTPSEYRISKSDGSYLYVESIAVNLSGVAGVDGIVTTTHVIHEQKMMELQLRESERKYHSLFENAILGIFRSTPAGRYLDMNPAFAHIAGFDSPEEMKTLVSDIGRELYIRPQDRQTIGDLLTRTGEIRGFETEIRHRTGESRWISMNVRAAHDEKGVIAWYEGTIEDITPRKRAETDLARKNDELLSAYEQLASSEEELKTQLEEIYAAQEEIEREERRYRQLFDTNVVGIALHEIICDENARPYDYRFLDVNPAFESQTGLSAKDVIGKTVLEVLPGTEPYWIETYGQVALTGEEKHFEQYSSELEKYYEVTAYSPEKGQFATLVLDITQKKRDEITLRENHAFLENLIANASGPIIVWNADYIITRVNRACEMLVGKTARDLIGSPLDTIFPPGQADRTMRLIRTTRDGVRWETVELDIQHQDGTVREVVWNSATLYDPEGKTPIATIAQGRDVTGERKLEKEKDAATRQIQENITKLAILNDGIRNPLTVIALSTQLCTETKIHDAIMTAVSQIDEMISGLDREWVYSEKILNYLRKHSIVDSHLLTDNHILSGSVQALQEISDHPSAENQNPALIEEIQAQLYIILDSIDALIYVSDMNSHDILFVNQKGRKIFGESAGKKCYQFLQEGQDEPCSFCTNHLLTDAAGPTGVYRWELYNSLTGRWYECRDRAIRWTDGRTVRLEIATDITDRKRMEEELQESEEKFRTIIETSHFGIGIHQDGIIEYVNPFGATILGYRKADDLIGKQVFDLVDPAFRQFVSERMNLTYHHQRSAPPIRERFIRADGTPVEVDVRSSSFTLHNRPAAIVIFSPVHQENSLS